MGNTIACWLGGRAVIPVANPQRRVSEVGFIISNGREGSGARALSLASKGAGISVDGAGRCAPPGSTERCFYLLGRFAPGRGCRRSPPWPPSPVTVVAIERRPYGSPGDYSQQVSPMSVYNITETECSLDSPPFLGYIQKILKN